MKRWVVLAITVCPDCGVLTYFPNRKGYATKADADALAETVEKDLKHGHPNAETKISVIGIEIEAAH